MPRGVRKVVDFPTKLQQIDEKIEKHNQAVTSLQAQREELLTKKQEADMDELSTFMQTNNLSAADVLKMLTPAVAASSSSGSPNKASV